MDDNPHKEFLLAALRVALAKVKLIENELTAIGVALRTDLIGPDIAVKWVHDEGLMWLIEPLPGNVGAIALANVEKADA